ncbi:MAG: 2TM domain-containing protein [Saprospiraceae bacterium]|nr:2TM domain-containing protein [Saprospiraceae bacterium]
MTSQDDALKVKARKKVKDKKEFYIHFGIYLICSIFFFVLNVLTGYQDGSVELWFFYPVLAWGVGVGIHYLSVFGIPGSDILNTDWEEREFAKELERLRDHEEEIKQLDAPEEDLHLPDPLLKRRKLLSDDWKEGDLV